MSEASFQKEPLLSLLPAIVLHATKTESQSGPPVVLWNILLTCKAFYRCFSCDPGDFYYELLAQNFDVVAPVHRLGEAECRTHAKDELRRRFRALKLFRSRKNFDHPELTQAFWIANLLIEDTAYKNFRQLLFSGLPSFLDGFIRHRLNAGAESNNGWPLLNETNSLAISLSWILASGMSSTEASVHREEMIHLLAPFVYGSFRYSMFSAPEEYFDLPDSHELPDPTLSTPHGPYPPRSLSPRSINYFGTRYLPVRIPSAPVFASLMYFRLIEQRELGIPDYKYATRQAAAFAGSRGPTQEDLLYYINECRTRFADLPTIDIGLHPRRVGMIIGQPSYYKLGTVTGSWQGSYVLPHYDQFVRWSMEAEMPKRFDCWVRKPLFITLQEHFTCKVNGTVPPDAAANGSSNAWLPTGCLAQETDSGMLFTDSNGSFSVLYETYKTGLTTSEQQNNVVDVIITGKTDDLHASAWGSTYVLGRIRIADGLVVLKQNLDLTDIQLLLRGYVTSSQNFVGRLKSPSNEGDPSVRWEGVFSLCRNNVDKVIYPSHCGMLSGGSSMGG